MSRPGHPGADPPPKRARKRTTPAAGKLLLNKACLRSILPIGTQNALGVPRGREGAADGIGMLLRAKRSKGRDAELRG